MIVAELRDHIAKLDQRLEQLEQRSASRTKLIGAGQDKSRVLATFFTLFGFARLQKQPRLVRLGRVLWASV